MGVEVVEFVTADTAKLIIENKKLMQSLPPEYNEAFDHKFSFFPQINLDEFNSRLLKRVEENIYFARVH
jgi:hypothetical protein